jgi:polysaccharide export outer membrane protein
MTKLVLSIALASSLVTSSVSASPVQAVAPGPAPVAAVPADYVIGPEDVLGVVFWREPDISGDVTVRPDGRITIPVVGEIQAAGLRPEQLQAQIAKAASKYITDLNVAVVVRTINSRKVFVTGRVTTPGARPLVGPLTVLQAIALAGGVTEYADAKNITILRSDNGRTETFKFNYRDVAKGRKLEQNILLRPGDTVVVP